MQEGAPRNQHNEEEIQPPADYLGADVSALPTVAQRRARLLEKLEIFTIYDLLSFFPRDYTDWTKLVPISDLQDKEESSFLAIVRRKPSLQRKGRMTILRTILSDESGSIKATWFNQPYYENKLIKDEAFYFRGKIRRDGVNFDVSNPSFVSTGETETPGILPVYSLTKGLTQGVMRQIVSSCIPKALPELVDVLPPDVRKKEKLCSAAFAYEKIHLPDSEESLRLARERLIFEELFLVQGGLRYLKNQSRKDNRAFRVVPGDPEKRSLAEALKGLPFSLTEDQNTCISAILRDLKREIPMNRLIQGDVGSGKTMVAAISILTTALCGMQSVLMAPTSILARQHALTLQSIFEPLGLGVELLLGSTPASEKKRIRAALESNQALILVGTHAVLSEKITFHSLALTITDEQHRFGVRQRASFLNREQRTPHTLVMSATPIPRTLALILYGDLDISVIRTIPSGRVPIETYTASSADEPRVFEIVRRQIKEGRQVYFVCPLIEAEAQEDTEEPSGSDTAASAVSLYTRLSGDVFPDLRVGLLHGGQKPLDKEAVMERFISGEVQILVCTTVVEVGVDNPNASLMVIENAEKFGLSQLHQLRGRVGRGPYRSVCILKSDKAEGLAKARMQTLCQCTDGFLIAKKDLELRGPGDFFGTRQHGIPSLRIANLYRDMDVLKRVAAILDEIYKDDPLLEKPPNDRLPGAFLRHFGSEINHPAL